MIAEFIASWHLFGHAYLAGWLIAALLGLLGVVVVARDQIFIGAAVSQSAVLGMALALALGSTPELHEQEWLHADWTLLVAGAAFAVAGALVTARGGSRRESHEAITGWVFLLASAGAVLLLTHSPHGMDEINRLLASTLIGATASDRYLFGALLMLALAVLVRARDRVLLVAVDPEMAGAAGVRVAGWNRGLGVALGLSLGLSIHVAGVIYAFGCLVLPGLIAKTTCREVRTMCWAAPSIAVAGSVVGFVGAHGYDLPPAQATVGLLAVVLAGAWIVRALRDLPGRADP